jgi:digeranylgeranylglycerophospholipid reductase
VNGHADVLVIGLGPAGSLAAAVAARLGCQVLAIDRKKLIGEPVQCGEFIPLPLASHARSQGVLRQRIAGMKTYLPSGATATSALPGLMVDRAAFDRALAGVAEAAGAMLKLQSSLVGLDQERGCARLRTPEGEEEISYRLLIAADGPHSAVAKALRLPPLKTVNTRQYTVPLVGPCQDTDIWLSGEYPGGYAWMFPKGDCANLGLGAHRGLQPDLKRPLDRLHQALVRQGRVGKAILARTGGSIPVGGLRERLVHGRVLFTGDAAGLTHPITGAGIAAAVLSGERAGGTAAEFLSGRANALEDFEEDVRDEFGVSLARALARRREMDEFWHGAHAGDEATHRRAWIAFPEYFQA